MSVDDYAVKLVDFGVKHNANPELYKRSKVISSRAGNLWSANNSSRVPEALKLGGLYALFEEFFTGHISLPEVSLSFTGTNGEGDKTIPVKLAGSAALFYHEINEIQGGTIDCRLKDDTAFLINGLYTKMESGLHIPDTYTRKYDLCEAAKIIRKVI